MHNALKWLIEKQGIAIGSMTVLVWASNLQPLPDIIGNPENDLEDDFGFSEEETAERETPVLVSDTISNYCKRLKRKTQINCCFWAIYSITVRATTSLPIIPRKKCWKCSIG